MDAERDIAKFLGMPACIVYAQAFSTISSVIPAFSKRGDIIVADKAVNFSIQKGLEISRSTIRWYEHNNMEDLERVLEKVNKEMAKKALTRRFIVTEGLFENTGDMVDLPKVVRVPASLHSHPVLTRRSRLSSNNASNTASSSMKPTRSASSAAAAVASQSTRTSTRSQLTCSSAHSHTQSAPAAASAPAPRRSSSINASRDQHTFFRRPSRLCLPSQRARQSSYWKGIRTC